MQARKPTKSELLHSLQLANLYVDRIEGEKESEQKKGTKATKRAAEWKATAEVARMEKRYAINKLKKAEESLSAVEMELKIERERTSDAIADVVSKVKVCWCCRGSVVTILFCFCLCWCNRIAQNVMNPLG